MNRMHFLACVLIKLSIITQCQVVPTWITSSFVQAESKKIINGDVTGTATGNSSSPTSTMTFLTPFPTVPNLGYGISGYQGIYYLYAGTDYLGEEMW